MTGQKCWKILTTLSGKGGVGKTTMACALGYSFAQMGFKTLIIDLDVGLRNLDLQFQVQSEIVFDLEHVLKGIVPLEEALIEPSYTENLSLLSSSLSRDIDSIPQQKFHQLLTQCRELFEIIIIDAPAGVNQYILELIKPTDKYLLVSQPHQASIRSIDKLLGLLQDIPDQNLHWIINRYNPQVHSSSNIALLEKQLNFKKTFLFDDLNEITIASSQEKYICRQHTPLLVNKAIALAQKLLAKDDKKTDLKQENKLADHHSSSWLSKLIQWALKSPNKL